MNGCGGVLNVDRSLLASFLASVEDRCVQLHSPAVATNCSELFVSLITAGNVCHVCTTRGRHQTRQPMAVVARRTRLVIHVPLDMCVFLTNMWSADLRAFCDSLIASLKANAHSQFIVDYAGKLATRVAWS